VVSPSGRALRCREITRAMLAEQGGVEKCAEARRHLIRRFATVAVLAEQIEAEMIRGGQVDIKTYAQLTSTLVRIAQCIDLDRPAKNNTPSLREYLSAKTIERKAAE
jgi:hypothetical protein